MGLMDSSAASGRLIVTPHPVLVDGQRNQPADLRPGESLCAFLHRHVTDLDDQDWVVLIGGRGGRGDRGIPRDMWPFVYPKHGQVIEVRGAVGRSAVALVATLALTYFTFGFGTLATWGAGAAVQGLGAAAATGIYMAGSVLINRVLQPKQPKASAPGQSAYSIAAGRNRARHDQPVGLLIGSMRIAPDLISNYYTHYEGDDQFLSFVLTPGVNVQSVEQLYNGDALLSSFDGVRVWHNGFPGMPSAEIPLYSNADVTDGGTLLDTSNDPKHQPSAWVQRTSSAGTIRLMVGVEFQIWDRTTKGKDKENKDQIQIQYRPAGGAAWQVYGTYNVKGTNNKSQRASYAIDVAEGQYDVRVRLVGNNTDGSGAEASFVWTTLTSVQRDTASYAGIPRIGIRMQANGQLNGAPDEIRCVAHSMPIPVWTGSEWVTQRTSNAGAWILAYARGIYAPDPTAPGGRALVAGMGLPERQIDLEGLKAFMLHCAANNLTYDNWITDVRSHQQVLDVLALAGFGQISWPRGRLSVGWAADEQPLSGVVNMATIKKGQFQVDYTLTNGADGIEYSYLDSATWQSKTLRVPAPGVTTMLNPAQVSGEGVTTEAHAVMLARWHLAQSLYQYKAISYSTDIEHLSYSRMSMLALQHDMTQWGFGGRVMGATIENGRATLQLDAPVPAPAQGNAFVGLRIPGERVYRVLRVQPFTGTSESLVLADGWPADAALPGNADANPAWDTLWIYDFKQTPGLRVRVVGIRPESDLKGAAVEVVAESPQFWQYVKTGEYVRDPNESLLQTRPVASDLKITERQVVQGDTEYTELQATFAITGPVGDTVVLSDLDGNAALEEVARTVTRTATWRIPGAGTYPITVRPYSPDGNAGVAASVIYTTRGADAPPVLVDIFDVEQLSGGVRRYTWGFLGETIQSANFAGVEIRYTEGNHAQPNWDAMTPVGDDGYHASAFEAVLPPAGVWTFACRSRNTSGTLSVGMRVVTKTLQGNLGEVIGGIEESLDEQIQKQVEQQQQIDRDRADSIARDAAEAAQRAAAFAQAQIDLVNEAALRTAAVNRVAADLTTETNLRVAAVNDAIAQTQEVASDLADETLARGLQIANERLAWQAAVTSETTARQSADESFSRQLAMVAAGSGTQFDTFAIWHFNTSVEGWTSNGGAPTIVDGWLRPANHASDSFVQSPTGNAVDGNAYRFVKVRIRKIGTPTWDGIVFWNAPGQSFDAARSFAFPEPSFDANGMATLDVDNIPWTGTVVDRIRIDLSKAQTATNYFLIDYVGIGRPAPGASVAMVQAEATARTAGDVAEANNRNTLAVQLRGNYTGTDVAGVTTGVVASEKNARISADDAQVTRINAMEVRMPAGAGSLATSARVDAVEQASVTRDQANTDSIVTMQSTINGLQSNFNAIVGGSFDTGVQGWSASATGSSFAWDATEKALRSGVGSIRVVNDTLVTVRPGDTIVVRFRTKSSPTLTGSSATTVGFIADLATPTAWVQSWNNWVSNSPVDTWVPREYTWVVPANFVSQQLYLRFAAGSLTPLANAFVMIDDVVVSTPGSVGDLQNKVAANAAATNAVGTRVGVVEGAVTAQSLQLTQLTTNVAGKAETATVTALTGRVAVTEGKVDANSQSLTNVQASLPAITTQGSNMITDGTFEGDGSWWNLSGTGTIVNEGRSGKGWKSVGAVANGGAVANNGRTIPVTQGRNYRVSCWYKTTADYNGSSGNSKVRIANQDNGLIAGLAFGVSVDWKKLEYLVNATTITGLRISLGSDATVGAVWVDDMWLEEVTDALANSAATQALSTTVTLQGTQITSQGNAVVALTQEVAGKATNTQLQALDGRVVIAEGKIDAQSAALTQVQSNIANIGGDNLLGNSGFEQGLVGYTSSSGGATGATINRTTVASTLPNSLLAARWDIANLPITGYYEFISNTAVQTPKVVPGQRVTISAHVRGTVGPRVFLQIGWLDAAGAAIAYSGSSASLGIVIASEAWDRKVFTTSPAPANAASGRVYLRAYGTATPDQWVEWDNVQMQIGEVATGYVPSMAETITAGALNSAATNSLGTRVGVVEGTSASQATALTNVTASLEQLRRSGSNMYEDGGFETRPLGTQIQSFAVTTSPGRTGDRAMTVTNNGSTRSVSLSSFDAAPDRVYYAEAWATRVGTGAGSTQLRLAVSNRGNNTTWPNFASVTVASIPTDSWVKLSGYVRIPAGMTQAVFQINAAGVASTVSLLWDDIVLMDVTEAYNAQQGVNANAQATTDLTGRVAIAEGNITAQSTAVTTTNARIDGILVTGDNLLPNSNFAVGMNDWIFSNGGGTGNTNTGVWGATSGDGGPGFVLTKASTPNPYLTSNNNLWMAVRPLRRYRIRVRAKALSGSGTLLLRLRRRHADGIMFSSDTQQTFGAAAFETKTFDYAATAAENTDIQLQVFAFPSATSVAIDRVELYDVTDQLSADANAAATTSLNAKATVIEGMVASQGTAITNVTATANTAKTASEANASGLTATNAIVTQQGQTITAQGSQITAAQASLGQKANSSAVIELDAKVSNRGAGGNLLANSTFAPNWTRAGWGWAVNGSQWSELGNPTGDNNWRPPNVWGLGGQTAQTVPAGAASWWQNDGFVPVVGDKTYCISAWVNCHRCNIGLELIWLTASGAAISTTYVPTVYAVGGNPNGGLQNIPRASGVGKAPANAALAIFRVVVIGRGETNPYFWLFQPMLCEVAPGANEPPPYSPGGKEDHASISMMTDVNGNISGIQNKNNGTTGEINMLANILNIISPGAVDGLELQQGYLRVWRGNVQRIIGNGFGPDGLMDYFGPNVGAGNASKGIATMWMDVNGNAYWGGALAAGVRRNANQSTSIQAVGNNVQVGPFDTNGGNKNVVVSFQRNIKRQKWASGSTGFVAGGGSNYAVIQVFRQVEGQGEGLWVQFTAGGDVTIVNQIDGADSAESYWSGSYTLNDQQDGTARRTYRAVVADYGERSVTHQSGSFDTQNVTQSLSLVSIEQ